MRKSRLLQIIVLLAAAAGLTNCQKTKNDMNMFGDKTIAEMLEQLTVEQKVNLVMGALRGPANPPEEAPGMPIRHSHEVVTSVSKGRVAGAAADGFGIPELGIPSVVYADGPAGLRIDPIRKGDSLTYYCTAFPTGTSLAASWDVEGVYAMAQALGNEVLEYGVDVLLAPAINIHRNPLCGRNFEYFSEDPYLAGDIATAYTQGVQSNGVGVSLKHFAVNNQETMRNGIDAQVSQRALREIYLKGFERVVKAAQPWTIMSSYNKVNGVLASENEWLLETVLRKEWGFEGIVMTDWWAEENGARQQAAGNDLLMPGTQHQYDEILEGLRDGTLTHGQLDRNVARMLQMIASTPAFHQYRYGNKPDLKAHAAIARRQASQGMVLLENVDATLPIASGQTIALFGVAGYDTFVGGSGSGNVNRAYKVSIDAGLTAAGYRLHPAMQGYYRRYLESEYAKVAAENFWVVPDIDDPKLDARNIRRAVAESDIAVVTLKRMAGEGGDRRLAKGDYYLSDAERSNIEGILRAAHAEGKRAVLLLNMGGIVDLSDYGDEKFDAIVHIWMPGQEAGNAVADLLSGAVNPSGKLPFTWARRYDDYPSAADFPLSEGSDRATRYSEDVMVGYRHFDTRHIDVLYPFGHGLSYTTFAYGALQVEVRDDAVDVSVEVTNSGELPGAEVVQFYLSSPASTMIKPLKELKAFRKTPVLQPHAKTTVKVSIPRGDLASFDADRSAWVIDEGVYTVIAAASVADCRAYATFALPTPGHDYRNATLAVDARVEDLLGRMTLDEKVMQLNQYLLGLNTNGNNFGYTVEKVPGEVGSVIYFSENVGQRNALQLEAMRSRLGIPVLFGYDVIHGFRTVFPIPLAVGCTWNPRLVEEAYHMAATEARRSGTDWAFAPMLDITHDARWGRVAEGYGEDPHLVSVLGAAAVRGYQGDSLDCDHRVAACLKHFVGYGCSEGGRDYTATSISPQAMWDTYLPPFQAAVGAGARTVMSAFNDINGVPATCNRHYLTEVLKQRFGLSNFVVSDWMAVRQLIAQGAAADGREAAALAINAGLDMDMISGCYADHLAALVAEGKVSTPTIDESVRRILALKFELGLFERPYTDPLPDELRILLPAYRAIASRVAEESIVLLKNESHLLPLGHDRRIALIGPMVKDVHEIMGSWRCFGSDVDAESLYDGMVSEFGAARLSYARGCDFDGDDRSGFAEARRVALSADVVVMMMGEKAAWSGENASRASLALPAIQEELIRHIAATGKRLVLVLSAGRPTELVRIEPLCDAILEIWQPGICGGSPTARILAGRVNPSGRLDITFPFDTRQLPLYYNSRPSSRPREGHYQDLPIEPLYDFGHGLSYTTYEYGDIKAERTRLAANDCIRLTIDVTNTGHMDGMETVQWYINDPACRITRPLKELRHFEKRLIKQGATETFVLDLKPSEHLSFIDAQGNRFTEGGLYYVMVKDKKIAINLDN